MPTTRRHAPERDPNLDHGSDSTYTNYRCRCTPCRAGHARVVRQRRLQRRAARVLVGTRWVTTADVRHGSASTYDNWGCQCVDCTEAHRTRGQRLRRERARRRDGGTGLVLTSGGVALTDDLRAALAAEAERGYDVEEV